MWFQAWGAIFHCFLIFICPATIWTWMQKSIWRRRATIAMDFRLVGWKCESHGTGKYYWVIFHSTDWVSSTMKICFLTVLETRSLRLQCHHGQFLLRSGWQVSIFFAVCSHNRERKKKRGGSLVSLPIRTLILSD